MALITILYLLCDIFHLGCNLIAQGVKNGVSNSVVLRFEIRWPVIGASPSKRVELYIICVHCFVYTATLGRSLLVGVVFHEQFYCWCHHV